MARGMWWDGEELKAEIVSAEKRPLGNPVFALALSLATVASLLVAFFLSFYVPCGFLILAPLLPLCVYLAAAVAQGAGHRTGVVVSDRTVRLRSSPLYRRKDIQIGDLTAVAAMRHPERALRLETADSEWILPAGNLTEAELDELVEAIRGQQTAHREVALEDGEAERRHAAAIRELTSRSENQ